MNKKLTLLGLCMMGAFSALQAEESATQAVDTKPAVSETSVTSTESATATKDDKENVASVKR